jgi:hypothetical protein
LRAKAWLKADDFDKGLAVARTRHPRSSGAVQPVQVLDPIAPSPSAAKPEAPAFETPQPERPALPHPAHPVEPEGLERASPVATEPPKQQSPDLQMKIDGGAKFARPWRVWVKKT